VDAKPLAERRRRERRMTIGPVQLIALGFDKPDFQGEIVDELERLRGSDTVRVIDALVVYKDADGEVAALKGSQLSKPEAEEFGAVVGGLLGLGAAGEEGMVAGMVAGAETASDGVDVFSEEEAWDVLAEIPNDAAAALILLEHRWAIGLRDAVVRAGGFRIAESFISPLDLVEVGLVAAAEAEALAAAEARSRSFT
jgi:uncharacterized membrane protein